MKDGYRRLRDFAVQRNTMAIGRPERAIRNARSGTHVPRETLAERTPNAFGTQLPGVAPAEKAPETRLSRRPVARGPKRAPETRNFLRETHETRDLEKRAIQKRALCKNERFTKRGNAETWEARGTNPSKPPSEHPLQCGLVQRSAWRTAPGMHSC